MPDATSMQDWASSGVKKLDAAGGDSARREVAVMTDDEVCGLMGANASIVEARAIKMARVVGFIFMVLVFWVVLCCQLTHIGIVVGSRQAAKAKERRKNLAVWGVRLSCAKIIMLRFALWLNDVKKRLCDT